jgi:DNA-binding MarR family transcriptional regulator
MTEQSMEKSISYLIAQVGKLHRNKAAELLAECGLYVGQEQFLMHLWQADGQTQSEIAEWLCVQPATVTRMLARMEKAGLVRREQDAEDARVSRVYLTEQGRELREPVEKAWQELERQTVASFNAEERALLRQLLLQLQMNLDD